MKALVLQDVEKLVVQDIPDPAVSARDVLLRVKAVGVCGTDLHIFKGHGNYNLDSRGRSIPLTEQPQILGHEFSGEVVEVGKEVTDLKPGDRVLCDQGINCRSQGRKPLCPYCASGDSHQCEFYGERGITGMPGAMAEYITMPAPNCLVLPPGMSTEMAASVEPAACVLHANTRAEQANNRFTFEGDEPIQNVLISGAGPAGLLFLQYLRNVKHFEGLILISDLREKNLDMARDFGGTPVNVRQQDLGEVVQETTKGRKIHYLIETSGSPEMFEQVPSLIRKQATIIFYATGYQGKDINAVTKVFYMEPIIIAPIGASGGFDPDGRPTAFRRARELVNSGALQVTPYITHHYQGLDNVRHAFEEDFQHEDYIKGLLDLS